MTYANTITLRTGYSLSFVFSMKKGIEEWVDGLTLTGT